MELPWGKNEHTPFVTVVGLVTSNGPMGQNVMAAEWTYHISYNPGIIAVFIGHGKATAANITKTKEFGVSIASTKQNVLSSIAGSRTGREYDKISALKGLGF